MRERRTLGFEELVDFSSCETSNQLLGEFVLYISQYLSPSKKQRTYALGFAILLAVVLVGFHSLKSGSSTMKSVTSIEDEKEDAPNQLVRELGFVVLVVGVNVASDQLWEFTTRMV